jgi:hypothetical protein
VIRDSVQLLWSFTLEGIPVRPLLDSIRPIGYHTWLNADTVFVFVLGSPATLQRAELAGGSAAVVARDIGRGLARVPGRRAISYAQRDSSGLSIRTIDPVSGAGETVIRLPAGNEFFAWTASGDLFSANGNRLLLLRPGDKDWTELARFADPGLQQISRLAVSPSGDRIALVGAEPGPPPGAAQGGPVVLLQPDRVFDGIAMRTGWSVLVRGDRIIEAGPAIESATPSDARRISLKGMTLLPGLIEGHSHLLLHPYNETSWDDQCFTKRWLFGASGQSRPDSPRRIH